MSRSVDPARAAEALRTIRDAIAGLRRGDDFLEDFVRARATVLSRLMDRGNDSRSLADSLGMLETFHMPPDYPDRLAAAVAAMTPSEVMALARKELDPSREAVVCEGARAALTTMFKEATITTAKLVEVAKPH